MRRTALVILVSPPAAGDGGRGPRPPRWKPVPTGSPQQYRGLDGVNERVAWVGGSAGEVRARPTAGARGRTSRRPAAPGCCSATSRPRTRSTRERAVDRRRRRVADLHDVRRRPQLGDRVRQRRSARVLRLHGLLRGRQARARAQRSGRRQVPDRRDRRLGPQLARAPERRDAARRGRRVRVRRQRHVPGHERPRRLVRHRRRRLARRSTRATAASPGPPPPRRSRPPRRAACSRSRSATRAKA